MTLSGGLSQTIGGLGATFSGTVEPKDAHDCCALSFADRARVAGRPLRDARAGRAHPAGHRVVGLRQTHRSPAGQRRLRRAVDGRLDPDRDRWRTRRRVGSSTRPSSGSSVPGTCVRHRTARCWTCRPTAPVNYSLVVLGQDPNASAHGIELTDNSEPCRTKRDTTRTVRDASYGTVGYWCAVASRCRSTARGRTSRASSPACTSRSSGASERRGRRVAAGQGRFVSALRRLPMPRLGPPAVASVAAAARERVRASVARCGSACCGRCGGTARRGRGGRAAPPPRTTTCRRR